MNTKIAGKLALGIFLAQPVALLVAQPQQPPPYDNQAPMYDQQQPLQQQQQQFSREQLSSLVAPIALYPDALLSQVLVAATYPRELQQAGQWLQQNGNLRGQDLVSAASQQPWDASIQALVVFPDVVYRMTSSMQWTTDLGNAFLAQQADVMNAVQALRAQARNSGRLNSTPQQNVIAQDQGPIEIQPADPQMMYVPSYNPEYIWGAPAYGYYPPLYYPRFGFGFGLGVSFGGFFGGGLGWGGWGWHPNWYGHSIIQNNYFFNRYRFNGYYGRSSFAGGREGVWAHNPDHRAGVAYGNRYVANRFGGSYSGGARGGSYGGNYQSTPRSNGYAGNSGGGRFNGASPSYNSNRGSGSYNAGSSYRSTPSQSRGGASQASPFYGGGASRSTPNAGSSYQSGSRGYSGGSRSVPNAGSSYQSSGRSYGGGSMSSPRNSGGGGSANYRSTPSNNGGGHQSQSRQSSGGGGGHSTPSQSHTPSNGGHRGR